LTVALGVVLGLTPLAHSQSIGQALVSKTHLCDTLKFSVTFTLNGVFNAGNFFQVELSDSTGFADSAFTLLSSVPGDQLSGPIWVTLDPSTPPRNSYRVRIASTSPPELGSPSEQITVDPRLGANIVVLPGSVGLTILTDSVLHFDCGCANSAPTAYLWDFGEGAVPRTSTAGSPPPVTYTTPGEKNVSLTLTSAGGCEKTFLSDNLVNVYSCSPHLPKQIKTIYPNGDSSGSGHSIHVLTGAAYVQSGVIADTLYVDSGATAIIYGSSTLTYARTTASINLPPSFVISPLFTIIFGYGATLTAQGKYGPLVLPCSDLIFDTSVAHVEPHDMWEPLSLSIQPNPATTSITATLNGAEVQAWEVFDLLGRTIFEIPSHSTNQKIATNKLPNGAYILRATTTSGAVERRFVISR